MLEKRDATLAIARLRSQYQNKMAVAALQVTQSFCHSQGRMRRRERGRRPSSPVLREVSKQVRQALAFQETDRTLGLVVSALATAWRKES
jgi:hypothetical protein